MRFIIGVAALLLAVVFAVQNSAVVTMALLVWHFQASLAVIIAICFAAGAVTCALVFVPHFYRRRTAIIALRRKVEQLEADNAELRSRAPGVRTVST